MLNRRSFLLRTGVALSSTGLPSANLPTFPAPPIQRRTVPVDGSLLPVFGLGTWVRFGDDAASREVLREFSESGARLVDSSPMYGPAEAAVGKLAREMSLSDRLLMASKVWTQGRASGLAQINDSMRKMGRIDLLQIHNLLDWQSHIETLRQLKAEGRIRYIGLTHYQDSAHAELEALMKRLRPDFIQVNLSIADRHAERRLLPAAADQGVAVLINRPFEEGALFAQVRDRSLPGSAQALGIHSWAQLFLCFVLGHPAVTCVLSATRKLNHLQDNLQAARVPALSSAAREQLAREFAAGSR